MLFSPLIEPFTLMFTNINPMLTNITPTFTYIGLMFTNITHMISLRERLAKATKVEQGGLPLSQQGIALKGSNF